MPGLEGFLFQIAIFEDVFGNLVGGLEHQFYFPIYWEFPSSQLTKSYFSEGWPNHQPVILCLALLDLMSHVPCSTLATNSLPDTQKAVDDPVKVPSIFTPRFTMKPILKEGHVKNWKDHWFQDLGPC